MPTTTTVAAALDVAIGRLPTPPTAILASTAGTSPEARRLSPVGIHQDARFQPALGGRLQASRPKVMVTFHADACDKCRRRSPVSFMVEPEEAWRTVVLNRWRDVCPSCFDADEGAPPSLGAHARSRVGLEVRISLRAPSISALAVRSAVVS